MEETYKVENNIMDDLVNYGFRSFNINKKLPFNIDNKMLDIIRENKIPILRISSNNSNNPIEFYIVSIDSEKQLEFSNISLKSNYFIFNDSKYTFS